MSPVDPQNYTPLDLKRFQYKTLSQSQAPIPTKSPYINVLLVLSVIGLSLSISYSIHSRTLSLNSRASESEGRKVAYFAEDTPIAKVKNMPTEYNGEKIPEALLKDISNTYGTLQNESQKKYVIDKLIRYYIYNDILKENSLPYQKNAPATFKDVLIRLPEIEKTVNNNLITKADFAYIRALFSDEKEKSIAQEKIDHYKNRFNEKEDAADIVNQSNTDAQLTKLNDTAKNDVLKNYLIDSNSFQDTNFNQFLFSQKVKTVSGTYTLQNKDKKEVAYIIVYPLVITKGKYTNINELIKERIGRFN